MNILVTGGTGFIGTKLINKLIELGHNVRVLSLSYDDALKIFGDKVEIFVGNILDRKSLSGCCEKIELIYQLVAKVGNERPSKENNEAFDKVNVEGLKNIVDEAKRCNVKRIIHISSIAAMGIVKEKIISEKSKCNPYLPYQTSKFKGEEYLLSEYSSGTIEPIILRPTKVYGYGEKEYSNLLYAKFVKKGFFPKIGFKKNYISNIYVDDLIDALINCVSNGIAGEIYILSSKDSISQKDVIKLISKKLNRKVRFIWMPKIIAVIMASFIELISKIRKKKPFVTKQNIKSMCENRIYDISKAEKDLNFTPKNSMIEGIEKTIDYYIEYKIIED